MTTLTSVAVTAVLDRLYADAERTDPPILERVRSLAASRGGPLDDRSFAETLAGAYLAVAPEVGRLLYLLVRNRRPRTVVEFGTSHGISAIHLAAALRDNGGGHLIATELDAAKARRAREALEAAGLADLVSLRQGDAFETLRSGLDDGIDLLLLDGWKGLYLPLLRQLEPALNDGALVIADDTTLMPDLLAAYLAHVREPANGYLSVALPLDDGVELSLRTVGAGLGSREGDR